MDPNVDRALTQYGFDNRPYLPFPVQSAVAASRWWYGDRSYASRSQQGWKRFDAGSDVFEA